MKALPALVLCPVPLKRATAAQPGFVSGNLIGYWIETFIIFLLFHIHNLMCLLLLQEIQVHAGTKGKSLTGNASKHETKNTH